MSSRAVQLRAQFPTQFDAVRRVAWVVTNCAHTLDELVDDARTDIPDVLVGHGLAEAGPTSWHTVAGPDGTHWLFADVPVRAWVDPRRDLSRRATTPAD